MGKRLKVNLNELAIELTLLEAGKQQVSIAQIKEVIRLLGERWHNKPVKAVEEFKAIMGRSGGRNLKVRFVASIEVQDDSYYFIRDIE